MRYTGRVGNDAVNDELISRAREFATRARDHRDRVGIVLLARAFHVLRDADGLDPWDPERLYAFATTASETTRDAVRFVLSVWNDECIPYLDGASEVKLGAFNVVEAMAQWDHANRTAFVTWAEAPWWP